MLSFDDSLIGPAMERKNSRASARVDVPPGIWNPRRFIQWIYERLLFSAAASSLMVSSWSVGIGGLGFDWVDKMKESRLKHCGDQVSLAVPQVITGFAQHFPAPDRLVRLGVRI